MVEVLERCIPEGTDNAERKKEALRLEHELLRGTKYEDDCDGYKMIRDRGRSSVGTDKK
jgi:hypothetical protein